MQTIYKEVTNVRWNAGVTLQHPISGSYSNKVDLSNYYTKTQLGTAGQSVVDFENISNAYHNHLLGLEGGETASDESSGSAGEYYHLDYASYAWVLARGGTGDTYWTEDSDNFLTPIESDGIKIGDLHIFDGNIIQGNAESQNHLYISCEDALEGNYPGSVTIRAGSAHTNNPGYGGGSIFLTPGNPSSYNTSSTPNESDSDTFASGYVILGGYDYTQTSINLMALNNSVNSNASINILSGGNGHIFIGSIGGFLSSGDSISRVVLSSYNGSIDIESYYLTFGWEGFLQSHDFYIGCYDNQDWDGANLHVKAGTTLGNDGLNGGSLYLEAGQGDEDGGHIYITAGRGENNDGGNVYIQTSWGDMDRGNIYFGDGAGNNTLPAASTGDDYVIRYNPTTGKLSYGTGGGTGDTYWQEDSIGDLSTVTAGAGVTIGDINIKNFTIQSTTPGYDIGIQAANAIEGEMMNGEGWGGNVYISSGAGAGSNGTGGSVYIFLGQGDGNNGNLFIADLPIADSADIQYVLTYDPYSKIVRYTQLI